MNLNCKCISHSFSRYWPLSISNVGNKITFFLWWANEHVGYLKISMDPSNLGDEHLICCSTYNNTLVFFSLRINVVYWCIDCKIKRLDSGWETCAPYTKLYMVGSILMYIDNMEIIILTRSVHVTPVFLSAIMTFHIITHYTEWAIQFVHS